MEMKANVLYMLGCGPGAPDLVTARVQNIVGQADCLFGCDRTLSLFPQWQGLRKIHEHNLMELLDEAQALLASGMKVAWLCTGDTSLFSVAHVAQNHLGKERCILVPGISSVQIACAELHVTLDQVHITSAHGRSWHWNPSSIHSHLCVLAGSAENVEALSECGKALRETHQLYVCADLSLPTESIHQIQISDISFWIAHPRVLLFWRKND
jgi:cobalt-precorrin-7 (C5)-methyltransferase